MVSKLLVTLLWFIPLVVMGEASALSYLNTLRHQAGLQRLHPNKQLAKAASAHARYLLEVQQFGHTERKGVRGFTGVSHVDRVLSAGYPSRFVMENIAVNTFTPKATIDNLMAAIYHRFVFLSFDVDEIGMGSAKHRSHTPLQKVDVFALGARGLVSLCKREHRLYNGMYYFKGMCAKRQRKIPRSRYEEVKAKLRGANARMVLYPYSNQRGVPPVFYNETPDPLPGYKVSGFPISVSFNPYYIHRSKVLSFHLYDSRGKVVPSRLLTHTSDPNGRLKPYEYALMPLKRLAYGDRYRVQLKAMIDGKVVYKSWKFTTRRAPVKLYRITTPKATIDLGSTQKIWLYFVPRDKRDILKKMHYTQGLKVRFIDQNTLEVTLPPHHQGKHYQVTGGDREVRLSGR